MPRVPSRIGIPVPKRRGWSGSAKTGPAHLRTGALGTGLLDVARDRSLVPGIGAVPAHAGEQRDARCDIEEAGAKGIRAFKDNDGYA